MLLTWQDFENTSKNVTIDFEHLCRIFFKYHYVKDVTSIFNQKVNNPGIETEPVLIDGKRVGFQAKYFSNNVNYADIFDSAQKVVKYYDGKIDYVCYHLYLWEEEYDYAKDDVIHITMPNKYIVNALKLTQTLDGVWQRDGEIVCADFRLIEGSNVDGLFIKEKYLRELLGDEFSMVWIGFGEKQHTYGMPGGGKQSWSEISSLIYEDNSGKLKEISKVSQRGSNMN